MLTYIYDIVDISIDCNILSRIHFRYRHRVATAVYQVTRPGHEHCDATEGILLDITPLIVDGKKLVTLYDKDLTEGVNLLIGMYFTNFACSCFTSIIAFCLATPKSGWATLIERVRE